MNTPVDIHPARVLRKVRGRATSDGAGVKLTRVIGGPDLPDLDPFLLLESSAPIAPRTTSPVFRSTRIAASRPSPTCSMGACAIATTMATRAC